MEFGPDGENEFIYLKWGFALGACLVISGLIISLIGSIFIFEEAPTLFTIFALWLFTNITLIIIYPFALYFILKKVNLIVPGMKKYTVAIYTMVGIFITNTVISSIIERAVVFEPIGLLPIIITFVVPAIYKTKA